MTPTSGEAQFARYAYPPNDLGHCGPPGAEVLLAGGATGADGAALRSRLARFEGAWHYQRLLAGTAGISDALDGEGVAAYLRGGQRRVVGGPRALVEAVDQEFCRQPGVRERLAHLV